MTETALSFADMLGRAKEAGGTSDAPPPGKYIGVVVSANAKRSKGDKPQVGLKFRVEAGPHAGGGIWSNQTLSADNATALDIWFRTFEALGIPRDWWGQFGANVDQACASAAEFVKGRPADFTVVNKEWPPGSGTMRAEVTRIDKPSGVAAGEAAPSAPAVASGPVPPAPPTAPVASAITPPKPPF